MRVDVNRVLNHGWDAFVDEIAMAVVLTLVYSVLLVVFAITLIGLFFIPALSAGFYRGLLAAYRGEPVDVGALFSEMDRTLDYLVWAILYGVIVLFGLILLILPGLLFALLLMLSLPLMVDRRMTAMESISESFSIGWNNFGPLLAIWLLTFVIRLASGMVPFGGLFGTPLSMLIIWSLYFKVYGGEDPRDDMPSRRGPQRYEDRYPGVSESGGQSPPPPPGYEEPGASGESGDSAGE